MDIQTNIRTIQNKQVRITEHADEEAVADGLVDGEISATVIRGEVIEDYPQDRPYPRSLSEK